MYEPAFLGVFDKIKDVFDLVGLRQLILDGGYCVGQREAALEDYAIGFVDGVDNIAVKASAAKSYYVQTAVTGRLTSADGVRHDTLRGACAAADHRVTADATELMHEDASREDCVIVDGYLAGQFRAVAYDDVVAYDIIVGDMAAFHEQVARTDNGLSLGSGATVYGYVLANLVVVTDDSERVLAAELQVLRHGTDDGTWEEHVATANASTIENSDAVHQHVVVANLDAAVDVAERSYLYVVAYLGFRVYIC